MPEKIASETDLAIPGEDSMQEGAQSAASIQENRPVVMSMEGGRGCVDEVILSMTMKNIAQQKQATMEMIAQACEKIVIENDRKTKAVKEVFVATRIIVKHKK